MTQPDPELLKRVEKAIDEVALWVVMIMAAPTIAGRHVIVRRRDPTQRGAAAEVSVNQEGVPVISISPNIGPDTVKMYLHELAHIRLGHTDQMARSNTHNEPPGSDTLQVNTSWEDQVNEQVNEWLRYGRNHADPTEPEQMGIVQALYKHYKQQSKEEG